MHTLTSYPKRTSSDQVKKAAAMLVTAYQPNACHSESGIYFHDLNLALLHESIVITLAVF